MQNTKLAVGVAIIAIVLLAAGIIAFNLPARAAQFIPRGSIISPQQEYLIHGPDDAGLTLEGKDTGGKHIVRWNGAGENQTLIVSVLLPGPKQANDAGMAAQVGFRGIDCDFNTDAVRDAKVRLIAEVKSDASATWQEVYNRRASIVNDTVNDPNRPCGAAAGGMNIGLNTDGTDKYYSVPVSFDTNTGMYQGQLRVRLDTKVDDSAHPNTNVFRFRLRNNSAGGLLGYANGGPAGGYAFNLQGTQHEAKSILPFGLTCLGANQVSNQKIAMYDPDPGFGEQRMKVFKRDRKTGAVTGMDSSDFSGPSGGSFHSNDWFYITLGDGSTGSITMKTLERKYQYFLIFYNAGGSLDATTNTVSFSLPQDSVNGVLECNYNFIPSIASIQSSFTQSVRFRSTGSVSNTVLNSTITGSHKWQITRLKFDGWPQANAMSNSYTDSSDSPCVYAGSRGSLASPCNADSIIFEDTNPPGSKNFSDEVTADLGQVICYMTSVQNPGWEQSGWRHSNMTCSMSGKQPKVHVMGHDLRAVGNIDTSTTTILVDGDDKFYRSWGEYGIFSDGCNIDGRMSSGSFGKDGDNDGNTWDSSNHPLTFANTMATVNGINCVGRYGGLIAPDFNDYKEGTIDNHETDNGVVSVGNSDGTVLTYASGIKRVLYYPNATVRIRSNLEYSDGRYTSINKIPRVIIIAKNIVIDDNVGRIDPWLIATGDVNNGKLSTCESGVSINGAGTVTESSLRENICNRSLVFNGPVMANKVYLPRTAGSGKDEEGDAAETFNLRADAFLSTYSGTLGQPVATTDDIDELPPRF